MKKLFILMVLLWSCGNDKPTIQQLPTAHSTPSSGGMVAQLEDRAALVIGNSAYKSVNVLKSPVNDAIDVHAKLKAIGFQHLKLVTNASRADLLAAVKSFAELAAGKTAVVYYSGHGLQIDNDNYMIPVEAHPQSEGDAKAEGVAVNHVLEKLEAVGCSTKIVILDACRDNPFEYAKSVGKTIGQGAVKKGLTKPQLPNGVSGTFLAFATDVGLTAPDGKGRNSPYTEALLKALSEPNLKIEDTFKRVLSAVKPQGLKPWTNAMMEGDFVFFPQKVAAPAPVVVAPTADPAEIAFQNLQKSQKLADWKNFVATYPKNTHLNAANAQMVALEQELKRALNDANIMKQDLPEDAKVELLKAKNIAPEHSEVIALDKFLNKNN